MCIKIKVISVRIIVLFSFLLSHQNATADIFFASKTIGPSTNIYALSNKGELKKITDDSAWRDFDADIANNGDIAFVSNRKSEKKIDLKKSKENLNIFELSNTNGEIRQITFGEQLEYSPVYSPDGKWLAYIQKQGGKRILILANRKNGELKEVAYGDEITSVSWSSKSDEFAYVQYQKNISSILLYNIKNKQNRKLLATSSGAKSLDDANTASLSSSYADNVQKKYSPYNRRIASAQFSPDNSKLAYILARTDKQVRQLHVLDIPDSKDSVVTDESIQVQFPVHWSKDGTQLLYSGLSNYNYYFDEKAYKKVYQGAMHVYLSEVGGKTRQITQGDFLHNRPVFSPDETRIAFLYADNLGKRELALHTIARDGSDRRELYGRVAGNSFLLWRE